MTFRAFFICAYFLHIQNIVNDLSKIVKIKKSIAGQMINFVYKESFCFVLFS